MAASLVTLLVFSVAHPSATGSVPGPFGLVSQSTWLHATGYAGLAVVLAYALQPVPRPAWQVLCAVFVLATASGTGIELLQATVACRTFDVVDILINAVGAAVAVVGWTLLVGRARFYRCRRLASLWPPLG
ncbi:MAG: VanZ family protein [Haloplanus sp.]